jgi:hypothetical protein
MKESVNTESNNTNLFLNIRTTRGQFQSINPSHHDYLELYIILEVCLQTMVHLLNRDRWELRLDQEMLSAALYTLKGIDPSSSTISRTL